MITMNTAGMKLAGINEIGMNKTMDDEQLMHDSFLQDYTSFFGAEAQVHLPFGSILFHKLD
jgi:hypothetical protein